MSHFASVHGLANRFNICESSFHFLLIKKNTNEQFTFQQQKM